MITGMKKIKRLMTAACFGMVITIALVFVMISMIGINTETNNQNEYLTTQVKVSSPPGLESSREINSDSNKNNYKLPSKRKVLLPLDHKKLVSELMAQEVNGDQKDPFAAPKKQQKLLVAGSKSQASVKLAGKFTVIGADPQYPKDALLDGKEGWVETKIIVAKDGEVEQVDIIAAGPEGIFENSVVQAVSQWKLQLDHGTEQSIDKEYFHRFEFKISQ